MRNERKQQVQIQGECIGLDFSKRGNGDDHAMLQLYVEDDNSWFRQMTVSSAYIDDFLMVLTEAKKTLELEFEKEDEDYGYRFKR